jgi:DNA-binding winged helix-turn-helix (wHTH) protein
MYRFSAFQLDPQTHELRKSSVPIKIQEQSFTVLLKLLESAGKLVPREDLRVALWPADTFVDFDSGLNTVIKRLREVLRDSGERSLFIETVPKLGYRFIAPVEIISIERPSNPLPEIRSCRGMGKVLGVGRRPPDCVRADVSLFLQVGPYQRQRSGGRASHRHI